MSDLHDPASAPPWRVLVADDHPIVRAGLVALLDREADLRVVFEARHGAEAVSGWQSSQPDVGLIDLCMPVLDGFEAIAAIRRASPTARLVVMTTLSGDGDVFRALQAGASGYLMKDCERGELVAGIRAVAQGRKVVSPLAAAQLARHVAHDPPTAREADVLQGLVEGLGNRAIARRLGVAEGTVKTHVKSLLAKLDATSRSQAAHVALQRGLVHRPASPPRPDDLPAGPATPVNRG